MSRRKKYMYTPFKKHFWIPFGLSLLIIFCGILMKIVNIRERGLFKGRSTLGIEFVLTPEGVMGLGLVLAVVFLFVKRGLK